MSTEQNGCHFAEEIFKWNFLDENVCMGGWVCVCVGGGGGGYNISDAQIDVSEIIYWPFSPSPISVFAKRHNVNVNCSLHPLEFTEISLIKETYCIPQKLRIWFTRWCVLVWVICQSILPIYIKIILMHGDVIKWKKIRVTSLLWGKSIGDRWIPLTKASDAELWCFLRSAPERKGWANNRDVGGLRRHCAHYDVTVMGTRVSCVCSSAIEVMVKDTDNKSP